MAGTADGRLKWESVKTIARADGALVASALSIATFEADDGDAITITVPASSLSLFQPGHEVRTALEDAVAVAFGPRSIIVLGSSEAVDIAPAEPTNVTVDMALEAVDHVDNEKVGDDSDGLKIIDAASVTGPNTPELREPLIDGIIREGGKLAIIGPPKSHKSMEAIHAGLCIATGRPWRGHAVRRTRVLYINVEIQEGEFYKRCEDVRRAMGMEPVEYAGMLSFLTLTGATIDGGRPTFETVRNWLELNVARGEFGCIVIDPLYKLEDGDENAAGDVNRMLYELDMLRADLDATLVYVHHTGKGGNAYKTVYEFGRGSSNFGGDADAVIGLSELTVPKDSDAWVELENEGIRNPASAAYEMQFGLRSFADPEPIRLLKKYPRLIQVDGILDNLHLRGDSQAKGGEANRQRAAAERNLKQDAVAAAVAACRRDGNSPTRKNVHAHYLRAECSKRGIAYPENPRSFERWTRKGGCTTFRTDPKTFVLIEGGGDE